MVCPNCNKPTHRLIIDKHGEACADCRGMSQNGGANLTGILTRSSDRVRQQQQQFEGDIIVPHRYDHQTHKLVPNEDFLARYPEMIPTYFTPEDLKKAGYSKPDNIYKAQAAKEAAHAKEMEQIEFVEDDDKVVETIEALA